MTVYIIISTAIFAFFSLIWKTSNWTNTILKFVMLAMTVFGAVLSLQALGYINS